jgi:AraC family transcriptional regulator
VRQTYNDMMTIQGELRGPLATAQLVQFHLLEPSDDILRTEDAHRLDLCLTPRPRNARARYRDRWSPHRFERIGPLFMVPAGEFLHARSDEPSDQSSVVCLLQPDALRTWFEGEVAWTDRCLEASLDIANPNIRTLLLRLAEEIRHPGFASDTLVELISAQIAIELGRYCAANTEAPPHGGLAPWRLRLIDERLTDGRAAPTLADLAALCRLSVRQLTRGFRVSRGCSIGDHMARHRIDVAQRMLKTEDSIKAVAYATGFSSPSSFCYAFRQATGETPRQFRQRVNSARR